MSLGFVGFFSLLVSNLEFPDMNYNFVSEVLGYFFLCIDKSNRFGILLVSGHENP